MQKKELGSYGENVACNYLEKIGYKIIERNFSSRQGEIDIIAKDGAEYVFVEVKTRSSDFYGKPAEAVNEVKKKHIYKTTKYYLYIHNLENAFVRFDVIEVHFKCGKYKLRHLKKVDIV